GFRPKLPRQTYLRAQSTKQKSASARGPQIVTDPGAGREPRNPDFTEPTVASPPSRLTCPPGSCQAFGFRGLKFRGLSGGAWARWRDVIVCPRAPRLTSVLDPGWLPVVGDMMCDGVFRQMVLRPLILSSGASRFSG